LRSPFFGFLDSRGGSRCCLTRCRCGALWAPTRLVDGSCRFDTCPTSSSSCCTRSSIPSRFLSPTSPLLLPCPGKSLLRRRFISFSPLVTCFDFNLTVSFFYVSRLALPSLNKTPESQRNKCQAIWMIQFSFKKLKISHKFSFEKSRITFEISSTFHSDVIY
jgi:hypothetical protein